MKVVIATEYGGAKGRGHLTRCTALAQGFQEKNIPVTLLLNGEGPLEDLDIEKEHTSWIENPQQLFSYDLALIDSYEAPLSLYQQVSEQVKTAVFLDDNNRLPYPKGRILNGNLHGPDLPYADKQNALLGLRYTPLRKPFWNCKQNPIRQEVKKILVIMGGTDPLHLKPKVERWIQNHFPEIEIISTKPILEAMLEADIAISAGGQTLYELARVGVPTVAIAIAKNQQLNIEGLKKAGTLLFAGWADDPTLQDRVVGCMNALLPHTEREKLTKNLIDGQGVRRIVEALL